MSLNHSPAVVTDGLQFYYDMGNTQKSWKGAPTTNLLTGPNTFTATYWALQNTTRTSSTEIAPDGTATASLFTVTTGYTPLWRQTSGQTAGATFTMSGHFKAGTGTTVYLTLGNTGLTNYTNALFNLTTGTITSTSVVGTGTYINSAITSLGNGWYRCSVTGIVDSSATLIRTDYVFPNSSTIYGCNMQLEVGSFATPFVNGTRSTAQALLDLTNNNTLTASSLTYASDNTFSFNGNTNYISTTNTGMVHGTSNFSYSGWVNFSGLPGSGTIFENGFYYAGILIRFQTNIIAVYADYSVSSYVSSFSFTPTIGVWYHLVITRVGNNILLYSNGVLLSTNPFGTNMNVVPSNNLMFIGMSQHAAGQCFNGKITNVQVYNKALSASEVTQNFNALRGRFGI